MHNKLIGNEGENNFSRWLTEQGITTSIRNKRSGAGIIKSDCINDLNLNIEVKNLKRSVITKYYNQSKRDADMTHTTPIVAIHTSSMPKDDWLIVINNWDWKDLIAKEKDEGVQIDPLRTNRTLIFLLKSGVEILKKIIRELEKIKAK